MCTRCALAGGRTQVVFGVGDPGADLMFVGEGPGRDEDIRGEPFVGRSGRLLDRLMRQEIGVDRRECYIANVVKCLADDAEVQLGDGSWERIGSLVRRRYDGAVRSVDAGGRIVERRVTGWHASPLAGRRVFVLSSRATTRAGTAAVSIRATGDHEVLTEQGWTPIERLRPGARIATGEGLSPVAHDVLVGSLLGGAEVRAGAAGSDGMAASDAYLHLVHSPRERAYGLFKASLLTDGRGTVLETVVQAHAAVGGDARGSLVHLGVPASHALSLLAGAFYAGGEKRAPSWLAGSLTARSLAFWFLDSGCVRARAPRKPVAELATWASDRGDLDVLVDALGHLGLRATASDGRIRFDALATRRLAQTVAPYVPRSMRHALPRDGAPAEPFSPALFTDRSPVTQFDEAVVEEIAPGATPAGSTYYCIDVAETHNFVTAAGVVHNCRPPGNRDPLPAEIAACRPYLERQIELVAPKVVVALGNFATRTLLGTVEGIRKVRGRSYPFGAARLVPTYHPAAALRGGGEVEAEMRADFVRAKALLRGAVDR